MHANMAAVANIQTVNITINDVPLAVPKGEMIVESAKRLGIEIPIFCYHPRMKPVGMCRMCLIEIGTKGPDGSVRMMPKPQTACSLPATEGLVVNTDTDKLRADRKGVLEFLLINHPLDCPICDRGGECPLQNNTLFYGPSTSRFIEVKRHAPKAVPLSKYVTLDLERCIQCGRCVRFTEEISGDAQLAFRFRGADMQPSTFELRDFTSKFSGNVIEICPVGALTNAEYRFRARPWDIETRPAICTNCGNGCNIYFDYRGNKLARVNARTNEAVNEEWTCDRGKFGHTRYQSDPRLETVLIRDGDQLKPSEWPVAYAQIAAAFGAEGALLGGQKNSNEDDYLMGRLFREGFKSEKIDSRSTAFLPKDDQPFAQSSIASFEHRMTVIAFGGNLADEQPILFLRLRKGWLRNASKIVVASSARTDIDDFAHAVLRYNPGTGATLAAGLADLVAGSGSPEQVASATGVSPDQLKLAVEALQAEPPSIVASDSILNEADGGSLDTALGSLATKLDGQYDRFGLNSNSLGASHVGLRPTGPGGKDTRAILEGCVSGAVKALWLLEYDPITEYPDCELAIKALESVDFLVVQGSIETEAMGYASVVLPMTAPAEADGTYTSIEGRVQRIDTILTPRGDAKPAWAVANELGSRIGCYWPVFEPSDVMTLIGQNIKAFAKIEYATLPADGVLLPL